MTGLEIVLYLLGALATHTMFQVYNETIEEGEKQVGTGVLMLLVMVWPLTIMIISFIMAYIMIRGY